MTFAAQIAAQRPAEVALRDADEELSWQQVDDRLRPTVNALLAQDLGPLRRVAILASNSAATLLGYVAATLSGSSAVAVNSHLTAPETAYILEDSEARLVLCDTTTVQVAAEAAQLAGVATVVAWDAPGTADAQLPDGVVRLADWCADDSEPRTDVEPMRTLVYTSGTTGRPKGVELPFTSWAGGADITEHLAGLAANRMVAFGRHLAVGPLYHSGPLTSTRLFAGGVPVTVLGKFDAEATLTAIERDRIGSSIMVPTHFQRLLALPAERRARADVSSLRYVLQVGAKCPSPVKRAMIDWLGTIVWESYGASEVGTTCMISAQEWLDRPGSVGRAVPPFEAYIADADGNPAPAGTEGPLWFRDTSGHGINYTSGVRTGSEFTLGEIGRMDDDGYVWITDRLSDMVVSGGVNIYPAEVEQALSSLPEVADVACFGIPDEAMGERLVALVVPVDSENPPTPTDIVAHSRTLLAGYKIPKEIHLTDSLPRTAVGKLDKKTMRTRHNSVAAAL
ncbi:AMP-binding protein [Gordonia jinghuaiqii]|uniref:AMP-binding protein n=1 Tax=Gordonia jinghuaiqii TaxID=2758710 RepID=A0A7D7LSY4_9ACTN|nr:AMP-binding protein [Gordonia jinghuaiqii]MCR5980562.1 AMP-binding protein [Gordonia jinghuaiqii]QMT02623.1 AMP-binding protein [Gordonia jinghuaiqii]